MIMPKSNRPSNHWQFDCDDDNDGFDLFANDDVPVDFESIFNDIADKSRGDYSVNGVAGQSTTTLCSQSPSHGANEHFETHNGTLMFPHPHESEVSASTANCLRGSSAIESHAFDRGFENQVSSQDVFPMHFNRRVDPWLANHEVHQDLQPFSNQDTRGIAFEQADNFDAYWFNNVSNSDHQLMDLNGYSNNLYDSNNEFSSTHITSINKPFYFDSSRPIQNSNYNNGMLLNGNTEYNEHLMQHLLTNSVMSYETVVERPGGVALVDRNSDIGTFVGAECSNTFISSGGESLLVKPVNEYTCNIIKNEKLGAPSYIPDTAHTSTLSNLQNDAKFETSDGQSGQQVSSQDSLHQKSETPLVDYGLAVPLLKHQRIALSWMSKKETKSIRCCGGILADDQGLGKTVSAIALILKERSSPCSTVSSFETKEKATETLYLDEDEDDEILENPSIQAKTSVSGGTLVVCPTSVLRQWNDELQNKVVREANLSVLVYHGANRTKDPIEVAKYDVVITTYAIVSMEVPMQPLGEHDAETKPKISPSKKRKYPPEGSRKDKAGPDNETFESIDRPLAKLRWFRVILDEAQSIKNYKTRVAKACWGLRAKRRWCLSGTPIQNSVDDLYSYFRFLKYDPFAVFKKFCSEIKAPIQKNPVNGYKRLQAILKTIMIRRTKGTLLKGQPIISLPPKTIILKKVDFTAEERGFYQGLEAETRAQFAEYAAAGTVKLNYLNILSMLLRLRQACNHPLLVKESGSTTDWKLSVDKAKQLPQEKLNRLFNCLESSLAICTICNDLPEDAVVTTCEHVFCNQCILERLSSDDNQCPYSECKNLLSASSVFCKSTLTVSVRDQPNSEESEVMDPCSFNRPVDSLKIEAVKALESSKIKAAVEVLKSISKPHDISSNDTNSIGNSDVREKVIVFSQWTRMLDLVEVCLKDSDIHYRRLDGTMSIVARDKAVKDFNTIPEVTVMIMSLKAASLGLNMVAACHVILLDLWWNPTTEDQAVDRAHRIGQTRPVTVYRFTVKDTVEDRILALQKKKRKLIASAFGEDENGDSQNRLTVDDMRYLFQG
ncbi:helicase-like transcription factor CHR28 [Rutidosis leptorrhynchoides]|uniref:helicase-like transcription factor CHR28 n=1 Tax=Rutidosis leptorrhynchoides TaxID=125765 RepID=UPI003A99C8DD